MANDYAENLFQAVDTIVGERIKNLPYDQTVVATIIDASNSYLGAYRITTDNYVTFTAYSDVTTYDVNDRVYVRITDTDYNHAKIITGKYVEQVKINNINSDTITYKINGSENETLIITKEESRLGYYLKLIAIDDDNNEYTPNAYSPDLNTPQIYKLKTKLYKLDRNQEEFIATQIHKYTYKYGINDGTTVYNYNVVLEGQYNINFNEQTESDDDFIKVEFTPIQQTVQQFTMVRCYTTLTSGVIIRSNVYTFQSNTKLSSKYRQFNISANPDQFFIFNTKGKIIDTSKTYSTTIKINYLDTFDINAVFKLTDKITINSNATDGATMFNIDSNGYSGFTTHTASITLQLNNNISLNESFKVETLTFKIIKDDVPYILTKDFYFGYQQIDSTDLSASVELYLNNDDKLKYTKLNISGLLTAPDNNNLLLGGKTLTTAGEWAGNAATATTATNLDVAPILVNNNKNIKITVGGKTSNELTVAFATEATELTNKPSLSNSNNQLKITVGGKTSDGLTIDFATNTTNATKLTTNAGSATQPVYFSNGIPVVTNMITISDTSGNSYDIINTLNKIIKALNTNVATKSGRTIWQNITI